ncbi:MAG TPA: ATP-binding protein [Pyrinomonadaceae bacterium]|jgi:two-component system chemotaxis sensor kinase CheA
MDDRFLPEFLAEAEDLLEALFADIEALRARHGEGRARRELVGRIFRQVHTIKGAALAAGLDATGRIAHELESLLDGVRRGRIAVEPALLDAFEDGVQAVSENLSAASRGREPSSPGHEVIERLRRFAPPASDARSAHPLDDTAVAALDALPEEIARSLGEHELHRLRETTAEGATLHVVRADFDLGSFDEQFRSLSDALTRTGEVISTLPGVEPGRPDRVHFKLLYATHESRAELSARVEPFGGVVLPPETKANGAGEKRPGAAFVGSLRAGEGEAESRAPESRAETGAARASSPPSSITSSAASVSDASTAAALTSLVRVPLGELDDLISTAHELFNETLAAIDLGNKSRRDDDKDAQSSDASDYEETRVADIRRRFLALEERLIGLRMVSVKQTLERVARAGLSAARLAEKSLEIELSGGEVRLDKSLADAIADPLLHLLRNAVDHGIEPPLERLAAGKQERGRIRLEAEAEGSRAVLRVADDGRGIDPERIARAAEAQGIFEPGAKLDEQQALRLIFRPGFSTVGEASSMSGRGVGLDVVESTVEQLGGELRVWSRAGAGTTFEMRLPTTLALVSASIIHSSGSQYCVDASHILEEAFISSSDIEQGGDGRSFALWRDESLPLVSMSALLSKDDEPAIANVAEGESMPVIISRVAARSIEAEQEGAAPKRAAVAVERFGGRSEVLVRSLGRHSTRWRGIGGATELGDGTIALLLDLPRLLEMKMARRF